MRTEVRAHDVERTKFRLSFTMRSASDERVLAEAQNLLLRYDYEAGESAPIAGPLHAALLRSAGPRG